MSCILLTGACGRLGRYVLEALGHRRHQVRTFDKAPAPECAGHIRADVLDRVSVRSAMTGVETVVHLAALDASVSAPEQQFFEVNVQGTWNVLEAAEQAGVQRVVLCSSIAVLGLADDRPPDSLPIDETHVCRPYQAYGLSKQIAEITAECCRVAKDTRTIADCTFRWSSEFPRIGDIWSMRNRERESMDLSVSLTSGRPC